jgi:hypothetical protein
VNRLLLDRAERRFIPAGAVISVCFALTRILFGQKLNHRRMINLVSIMSGPDGNWRRGFQLHQRCIGPTGSYAMSALGSHKRTCRLSIHVRSYPESRQLFLAVFLHVAFSSFFGVISSVKRVAPGGVCMMPRFFVPPAFMMFGCLTVMMRGMRMMFRGLLMVLGCFF